MDKLKFIQPRPKEAETNTPVMRVSRDFYNLVQVISVNTGLSPSKVTERIAEYLSDKIIFERVDI